ncbi:hypothetical protein JOB18_005473 [Solea senegalensis]|uniref:Transmembrane protein n=1 Tax=Solea senegalensis TaxID=28829 RepID=A0AAV6SK35_SOLSE|nr:hypothetical protein JOB18_005473 [Solea senegalensis]
MENRNTTTRLGPVAAVVLRRDAKSPSSHKSQILFIIIFVAFSVFTLHVHGGSARCAPEISETVGRRCRDRRTCGNVNQWKQDIHSNTVFNRHSLVRARRQKRVDSGIIDAQSWTGSGSDTFSKEN